MTHGTIWAGVFGLSALVWAVPTAIAGVDPLVAAVTFALTGTDNATLSVVDRANCVFDIHSTWGDRRNRERYYLNAVDPTRIKTGGFRNGFGQEWIIEDIAGEGVIYETTSTLPGNVEASPTRHNKRQIRLETTEMARLTRAWQYIYSHGCTGKRSAF